MYADPADMADVRCSDDRCIDEVGTPLALWCQDATAEHSPLSRSEPNAPQRVHDGVRAAMRPVLEILRGDSLHTERHLERLSRTAISLLPAADATIFLSAQPIMVHLARCLPEDHRLTVYTASLPVAAAALANRRTRVHLLPGLLMRANQSSAGAETVQAVRNLNADIAFLGADGIEATHGFSNDHYYESQLQQSMSLQSRTVAVLATQAALGVEANFTFAGLPDADYALIAGSTPTKVVGELSAAGVAVMQH